MRGGPRRNLGTDNPPGPRPQAQSYEGLTIIPPGSDADYLATAPVGLIPMDDTMAEALAALGLRTAGALAALPSDDVEQRWGRTGLNAWRLAHGHDRRRPGLATAEFPRMTTLYVCWERGPRLQGEWRVSA